MKRYWFVFTTIFVDKAFRKNLATAQIQRMLCGSHGAIGLKRILGFRSSQSRKRFFPVSPNDFFLIPYMVFFATLFTKLFTMEKLFTKMYKSCRWPFYSFNKKFSSALLTLFLQKKACKNLPKKLAKILAKKIYKKTCKNLQKKIVVQIIFAEQIRIHTLMPGTFSTSLNKKFPGELLAAPNCSRNLPHCQCETPHVNMFYIQAGAQVSCTSPPIIAM